MERFKNVMNVALGITAVATVILSGSSYMKVSAAAENVGYDEHILLDFNKEVSESDALPVIGNDGSLINLNVVDNKIVINDSRIAINGDEDIIIKLKESYNIEYDYALNFIKLDNRIIIKTVNAEEIEKENISQFINEEGKEIILGQMIINEKTGISIVIESSEETKEKDIDFINNLKNSFAIHNGKLEITFMGQPIDNAWNQNLLIADNVISISNGSDFIYIAPFENDIVGAGFEKEIKVNDNLVVLYSDIKDAESGYIPYIIKTENGNIKLLATSNEVICDFFGIEVPNQETLIETEDSVG